MEGQLWDVWLDGVLQKNVFMADDVTGEVERYITDGVGFGLTEMVLGNVEIRPANPYVPKAQPAKAEGLVAPVWSDSGDVPVGEVTYTCPTMKAEELHAQYAEFWRDAAEAYWRSAKPSDPNAKPSMPALSRIAGEAYRGLGWCDE
jgi:hypothetical protein